jgi:hypothetical protein
LRNDQVDPIFDALESGLKDFPMGEHLTIHLESFTSDVERQQQLSELIKTAPSQELQFLLMGERARVKELTDKGIRKPKTLRLYASYTRPLAKVVAEVLWGLNKSDRLPVFCDHSA